MDATERPVADLPAQRDGQEVIHLDRVEKVFEVRRRAGLLRREKREVRAVDGLSFSVGRGEVVGFVGPNGAGKSTTIKMLTGILTPSSRHPARRGRRTRPRPGPARPPYRRRLRPAHHPLVGPAAARLVPAHPPHVPRPRRPLPGEPRPVRRTPRPRRPAGRPRTAALPRPADARRHRGGPPARSRGAVPGRADHRPRRRLQGQRPALPRRPQRRTRHHRPAHHPRPHRHRAALPPRHGHRPRPPHVRRRGRRAPPDRRGGAHPRRRPRHRDGAHRAGVGPHRQGRGPPPVARLPGRAAGRADRRRDRRRMAAGRPLPPRTRHRGRHLPDVRGAFEQAEGGRPCPGEPSAS